MELKYFVLCILYLLIAILLVAGFLMVIKTPSFIKRNKEVCEFRLTISNLVYEYNMRRIEDGSYKTYYEFYNKFTYDEMLFSKKPLTLEEWYTKEEIAKLKH